MSALRIAVVHSFYSSRVPSGENQTVAAQIDALRKAGHEVGVFAQSTDERLRRLSYPLEAMATTMTGFGPDPTRALHGFDPDVVHVHNLFPNFSHRWLARWPGRLVATLHNFRPMCANGYLYRDGGPCVSCLHGSPPLATLPAVRHGCFHGSRVATLPLAWSTRHGAAAHPVVARADALVALSPRARSIYSAAGVAPERLHVVPNFVDDTGERRPRTVDEERWLCVARLTPEKGVLELVTSWPTGRRLDVVGDGELGPAISAAAPVGVRLLGAMTNEALRAQMCGYTGLIVPSRWFEGMPTVYLEALCAGLPVVAVAGSSAADDVEDNDVGVVIRRDAPAAEIAGALDTVVSRGPALRAHAHDSFRARFGRERWLDAMRALYVTFQEDPLPLASTEKVW